MWIILEVRLSPPPTSLDSDGFPIVETHKVSALAYISNRKLSAGWCAQLLNE